MEPDLQKVQVSAADRLEGCQGTNVQRRHVWMGLEGEEMQLIKTDQN